MNKIIHCNSEEKDFDYDDDDQDEEELGEDDD